MNFWPKSVPEHPGSIADHSDKVWTSSDLTRPLSHLIFEKRTAQKKSEKTQKSQNSWSQNGVGTRSSHSQQGRNQLGDF